MPPPARPPEYTLDNFADRILSEVKNKDIGEAGKLLPDILLKAKLKPSSSGKLFDQYLAGGLGAEPMVVGYENQRVEWILADLARWEPVKSGGGAKPVALYPRPTAFRRIR